MNRFASVVAVCCAVVILAGCSDAGKNSNARNIEAVLARDKALGDELERAASSDPVGAVRAVVTGMKGIDLSGCPQDFRVAYVKHTHAWSTVGDVLVSAKELAENNEGLAGLIKGFIRGLGGDFSGGAGELLKQSDALQRQYEAARGLVRDTWHEVELIATQHGANLPR